MKKSLLSIGMALIFCMSMGIPTLAQESRISTNNYADSKYSIKSNGSEFSSEYADIDYFKEDVAMEEQVMDIYYAIQEMREDGYTAEQIEEAVEVRLNMTRSLDNYVSGYLNSQEEALYDQNPTKGLLCMANGKLALDYAQDYYNYGLTDGNGDAFRHVLWNYGMVIDVGYDFAKAWSDAHEYGSTNNTLLARNMDLYNNRVGLTLGLMNPSTVFHSTFISNSQEKVRNGKCLRIVNNRLIATNSDGEK